jgi:phosphotriesterase-related protein
VTTVGLVQTVLGVVPSDTLGTVDYHDHLFHSSPILPGDEICDEAASAAEAGALRASGFSAMIDATPIGLGRRPEALARISAATGLAVVAATGLHRQAHYLSDDPLRRIDVATMAAVFERELTVGQLSDDAELRSGRPVEELTVALGPSGTPVLAGLIKTGIDYWRISHFERTVLDAAALAHGRTGAPIMVHLEYCTAAHEVLDLLASEGVQESRVVLAHADRDPDPGLHLELINRGAYLGYDGMARPKGVSEAVLLELTQRVVEGGGGGRLLLGADVARGSRYVAYGGMPGLAYLGRRYLPRLRNCLEEAAIELILVTNPARLLASAG